MGGNAKHQKLSHSGSAKCLQTILEHPVHYYYIDFTRKIFHINLYTSQKIQSDSL